MNLLKITKLAYSFFPVFYNYQLWFFNGNHFQILKSKIKNISHDSILEIGCGTAPILEEFSPDKYIGVDPEKKFIDIAKKRHKNKKFKFYLGEAENINKLKLKENFDIILLSHTTHHFTDSLMNKFLKNINEIKFKYLIIYDGKPVGPLAPILTRLDLGAKFRELEEFYPFFKKNYKLIHAETFRSNRPFYKYPLLIIKPKK